MKKKLVKFFLFLLFLILIPIIIVIYSYMPQNMIKLDAYSEWEYFCTNITHALSLKLLIAILVSGIITGGIWILIRRFEK